MRLASLKWQPRYVRSDSTSFTPGSRLTALPPVASPSNGRKARRGTASTPRRQPVDGARGALILIGGGCSPDGAALGAFVRLSGADHGAPIVGFTTASGNPGRAAAAWRRDFASI